jgi:hypothetical protein
MSIDIAAEVKFSHVADGEYFVRLQDDQTIIGRLFRADSGWKSYSLDHAFQGFGETRYLAARSLLEAYELANGLRDSEGRRVTKELETNLWCVADHSGRRISSRWTDKTEAIAKLATLNIDWQEVGREAFHNGDMMAPALNAKVMAAIGGYRIGDPETQRVMQAFIEGYRAMVDEQPAEVLAETKVVARRSTRAGAEAYIARFADELGDTVRWDGSANIPVHIEWTVVPADKGFNVVSTVTDQVQVLGTPASEDDLGVDDEIVNPDELPSPDSNSGPIPMGPWGFSTENIPASEDELGVDDLEPFADGEDFEEDLEPTALFEDDEQEPQGFDEAEDEDTLGAPVHVDLDDLGEALAALDLERSRLSYQEQAVFVLEWLYKRDPSYSVQRHSDGQLYWITEQEHADGFQPGVERRVL